jgi:hypothetical protein
MANCPLYNSQNLNFTGNQNPYALIQNAGKIRKSKKSKRHNKSYRRRKTRRHKKSY